MTPASSRLRRRILIVDDDAETRDALEMCFAGLGHDCELAEDGVTALGLVERLNLDAVICDVRMGGMSGLDLLDRVKRTHPALPFVIITGAGGIPGAVDAMKRGASQYLTKPCDLDELRAIVESAIVERRPSGDEAGAERRPSVPAALANQDLIGDGPAMRSLRARVHLVAASNAPAVITGETGAGKELVARAIHAGGSRRSKPFVAVNTSAIPSDLLESEIFGHVRGGFTGAVQSRKGLLTEADGGTLLLDEIGDMPADLQAKLLRVLQFGDVRPVGGDRGRQVDVRVIAATHRDLPALVREGRFREDSLLPAQCPARVRAAAARPPGRHPRTRRPSSRRGLPTRAPFSGPIDQSGGAPRARASAVAGERPRTGQRDRARRRLRRPRERST